MIRRAQLKEVSHPRTQSISRVTGAVAMTRLATGAWVTSVLGDTHRRRTFHHYWSSRSGHHQESKFRARRPQDSNASRSAVCQAQPNERTLSLSGYPHQYRSIPAGRGRPRMESVRKYPRKCPQYTTRTLRTISKQELYGILRLKANEAQTDDSEKAFFYLKTQGRCRFLPARQSTLPKRTATTK